MRILFLAVAAILVATGGRAADLPEPQPPTEERPLPIPNAGEIIGLKVINEEGRTLGEVDDLVVGGDGQVEYLVIRRGGFFGFRQQRMAVPWAASRPHIQEDVLIVSLSEERLKGAPAFASWDDFRRSDYPERVRSYFGLASGEETLPRPIEGTPGQPPPSRVDPPSSSAPAPLPER
jgi:sporulation protein YlmC with PRC-barrel domain